MRVLACETILLFEDDEALRELRRAERRCSSRGFVMFDIDHFKRFNDAHGHDAGELLLRELGAFVRSHVRSEDIACRYGARSSP